MSPLDGFRSAYYGDNIEDVQNAKGSPLFKDVTVTWTEPKIWRPDKPAPTELAEQAPGYLYALVRNHHRAKTKDKIVYIGITNDLKHRFYDHPKAEEFCKKRGDTALSIGNIDFHNYRTALAKNRRAIEELEHIFIWTMWWDLWNERKQYTLPGMGRHPGRAWHIVNDGYRFAGRMPREIVYPWMLLKPGRDRSRKAA